MWSIAHEYNEWMNNLYANGKYDNNLFIPLILMIVVAVAEKMWLVLDV